MNETFLTRFPGQLGRWMIHGVVNSLPSLFFAVVFLDIQRPDQIGAILLAIGCIVMAFAITTSLPGPLLEERHVLFRALALGLKVRTVMAILSMLLLPFVLFNLPWIIPDLWFGMVGVLIQTKLFKFLGWRGMEVWRGFADWSNTRVYETVGFLPVFVTALLEGFILSFLLLMISFFCVMFIQSQERRKFSASIRFADDSV